MSVQNRDQKMAKNMTSGGIDQNDWSRLVRTESPYEEPLIDTAIGELIFRVAGDRMTRRRPKHGMLPQ